MLFKRYLAKGLASYSYMVGDGNQAVVIDPRRDIGVYLHDAEEAGFNICLVLETHRNEDYLTGSCELEAATGAVVYHADSQLNYQYGQPVQDGDVWQLGRLKLTALSTPGHTPGSMSYLLRDPDQHPWMVFTGDTLFSGDAGRVDLVDPARSQEMAGLLFDSLKTRILPLGDGVIVCPGHGMGSACGSAISDRTWTTIGLEKKWNPKLQFDSRETFITHHAKLLKRPPYFRKMEVGNIEGPSLLGQLKNLKALTPGKVKQLLPEVQILDVRQVTHFAGGHLPGSLYIWSERLAKFAGWFLDPERPIVIIDDERHAQGVQRQLLRIGFDHIVGYLKGGLQSWGKTGLPVAMVEVVSSHQFCQLIRQKMSTFILDIRDPKELSESWRSRVKNIPLTMLLEQLNELSKDQKIYIVCNSGVRSMIAASLLLQQGFEKLAVPIGGEAGLQSVDCQFD